MTGLPAAVAHRVRGHRVEVTEPLGLGAGGRRTTTAVQFLRECQSLGLTVDWQAADARTPYDVPPYDVRLLRHLPPPGQLRDERAELRSWRAGYSFGMLYHRRGPGFVTVMDRRETGRAARLTLDHPDLLSAFHTLLEPTPLDDLDPGRREAADLLAAERLALVTDGWAVALPPRVGRWPVPCTGI